MACAISGFGVCRLNLKLSDVGGIILTPLKRIVIILSGFRITGGFGEEAANVTLQTNQIS